MLLNASATVTVCHSQDCRSGEVYTAGGPAGGGDWPAGVRHGGDGEAGATLIDVGINRVTDAADVEKFFAGDAARAATFAKRGSVVVGGYSFPRHLRLRVPTRQSPVA